MKIKPGFWFTLKGMVKIPLYPRPCLIRSPLKQEEIRALHEKEKDLQQKIKGLEREIAAHKREIKYRDDTIGEKEKKIYELKKKNQEASYMDSHSRDRKSCVG